MPVKKDIFSGVIGAWVLLLLVALVPALVSCDEKKSEEPFSLQNPVPEPKDPLPPDPLPPPPVTEKPPEPAIPDDPDTAPVFRGTFAGTIFLKENERWEYVLPAEDPDGGPISFFYQCPYACPSGVTISPLGQIVWTPGYDQAGLYDVRIVATDSDGESTLSDSVRFIVENTNRAPEIFSVEVIPDRVLSPRSLTCVVTKKDLDGDVMTTRRTWYVDGELSQVLSGMTVDSSLVMTGQHVVCLAEVSDENGASASPKRSEEYLLPNVAPVLSSVRIANASDDSVTFRVGDPVTCRFSGSDQDGHILRPSKTEIIETSTGRVVASDLSGGVVSYTLTKVEAHKTLHCFMAITDGFDYVTGQSTPIFVANTPPAVSGFQLAVTGDGIPMSGATVRCEIRYSDADGDAVIPEITFRNGPTNRGTGFFDTQSDASLARRYTLRSVQEVSNPLNADIRGMTFHCAGKAQDIFGAITQAVSNSIEIVDSPPLMSVNATSGPLSQTVVSGQIPLDVVFSAVDRDGDAISFERVTDSCSSRGITLSVAATGKVTSTAVPPATILPQGPRDCGATFRARTDLAVTVAVGVNLSIPNRAPTLSCTNKTQFLKTAGEDYLRRQIPPAGSSLVESVCDVLDLDGGDAFEFTSDFSVCAAAGADLVMQQVSAFGGGFIPTRRKITGTMGLDPCSATVIVSDGQYSTSPEQITLTPFIDLTLNDAFEMDSACWIRATGIPSFSGGYDYDSSLAGAGVSVDGADTLSLSADRISVTGQFSQVSLESKTSAVSVAAGQNNSFLQWTMRGYSPGPPASITSRVVSRLFDISKVPITDPGFYALRPMAVLNFDSGEGRQVSPTSGCLAASSCPTGNASNRRASIAAGKLHTCVLGPGGIVQCWGDNSVKQLGVSPDTVPSDPNPVRVVGGISGATPGERAVAVSAGERHTCAVMEDGTARCWGENLSGQLGRGSFGAAQPTASPVINAATGTSLTGIVAVAAGDKHSCAFLSDKTMKCWGAQGDGALGVGNVGAVEICGTPPPPPTPTPPSMFCSTRAVTVARLSGVASISAGGRSSCAVLESGTAACWGSNGTLQLGLGVGGAPRVSPYDEIAGDGSGDDDGDCETGEQCALVPVKDRNQIWTISMSRATSCAISKGGTVSCWGRGVEYQHGNGLPSNASKPAIDAETGGVPTASVATGYSFTCHVSEDRLVRCHGENARGQIGSGSFQAQVPDGASDDLAGNRDSVVGSESGGVFAPLENVVAIAAGENHACAVDESRRVWCWGDNSTSQLGRNSTGVGSVEFSRSPLGLMGGAPIAAARSCSQRFAFSPRAP